jgi:hypothetical protein
MILFQIQNPLFEADSKLIFSTLLEQPSSHILQNAKNASSHLNLLTKYQLKMDELDYPFKFEWNLRLCSTDEVFQHSSLLQLKLTLSVSVS